jgi:hypothetical protein
MAQRWRAAAAAAVGLALSLGAAEEACKPVVAGRAFDLSRQLAAKELVVRAADGAASLLYLSPCFPLANFPALDGVEGTCGAGALNVASVNLGGCKRWGELPAAGAAWSALGGDAGAGLSAKFVAQGAKESKDKGGCPGGRSALLNLRCSAGAAAGEAISATVDGCALELNWTSSLGCPVSGSAEDSRAEAARAGAPGAGAAVATPAPDSSSGGAPSWLVWACLLAFLAYCVLGVAQNTRNEGRRGLDAIPHRDLWFALPGAVSALCRRALDGMRSLMGEPGVESSSWRSSNFGGGEPVSYHNVPPRPGISPGGAPLGSGSGSVI